MALVRSPVYTITVTMEDRDKNTSTVQFHCDIQNTIAEIVTAIDDFFVIWLQGLSNAIVKSWTISTTAEEDQDVLAPEESDVQRKGVFSFTAANGASYVVSVPSIKNTLVVDRTNVINTADPFVSSFTSGVLSSGPLALVRPRTYLGSDIRRLEKAVKHHRGSRRG
jgi:hypothetical protein